MLADEAATQHAIMQALDDAASSASPQTLFVFYFAGHSILGNAGDIGLACFDSKPRHGMRLVTIESVKAAMERAASKSHLLFLDTISSDSDGAPARLNRLARIRSPPSPPPPSLPPS